MKRILFFSIFLTFILFILTGCTKEQYSVTFLDYDGTLIKEEVVRKGNDAFAPNVTRIGYKFSQWDKNYTKVEENLILRAEYIKAEIVEIRLFINNTLYKEIDIEINDTFNLDDLTDVDYFDGWYYDFDKTQKVDNDQLVATENKNFYAFLDYNDLFKYTIIDNEAYITGFSGNYSKILIIPNKIKSYNVVGINKIAFSNFSTVQTLIISEGIKTISRHAFSNCRNLLNVYLPDSIIKIEEGVFSGCSSLENVKLSNSLQELSNELFYYCINLKEINLTSSIKYIQSSAFENTGLVNIVIPATVEAIYNEAFLSCNNLEKITIEEGLKTIGTSAFRSCIKLEEITIPNSVTDLNPYILEGCYNIRKITIPYLKVYDYNDSVAPIVEMFSKYYMENSIEVIGSTATSHYIPAVLEEVVITGGRTIPDNAFENIDSIKKITLPDTLLEIGKAAFRASLGLEEVNIPKNIVIIPEEAFMYCRSLKSVLIPKAIKRIDANAFAETNFPILFEGDTLPYLNPNWNPNNNVVLMNQKRDIAEDIYFNVKFIDHDNTVLKDETIKMGESASAPTNLYRIGYIFTGWDKDYNNVTSDLTLKAKYEVNNITYKVTFVDYDDTILKVQYVYSKESASAPTGLKRDKHLFYGWDKNFSNVSSDMTIKAVYSQVEKHTVNVYLNNVFYKSVEVNDNAIYELDNYTTYQYFKGWYSNSIHSDKINTSSITVTKDLDLYCYFDYQDKFKYVLYGTSATITSFEGDLPKILIIPTTLNHNAVVGIDKNALANSSTLEELIVPEGIFYIGSDAFKYSKNLKKVRLADSLTSISDGAFSYCTDLMEINIPKNITQITERMFQGSSKLSEIIIPYNIKVIGTNAFSDCTSLKKVYIPSSVMRIYNNAFTNCVNLIDLKIEEGLNYLGSSVFENCSSLTEVVIPKSVKFLSGKIFSKCISLKKLSIPFIGWSNNSDIHIGQLFSNVDHEKSVLVKYNNSNYFLPKSLEEVNITNATTIFEGTFQNCVSIKKITLPDTLISINSLSFQNCKIDSIFIPDSVIIIGTRAFEGCDAIFYCESSAKKEYWYVDWITNVNVFYSKKR